MSLDGDSLAGVFSKVFFCRVAIKKKKKKNTVMLIMLIISTHNMNYADF